MSLTAKVRHRLSRELRNSSPLKEVGTRLSAGEKRIAAEHERLDRQIERAEAQNKRIDRLTQTLASVQERLKPVEELTKLRDVDLGRMSSQVAALEARAGRLEEQLTDRAILDDLDADGRATATSLLEEIRREHEQIRVRMQIVTWYEERLRRVEASITALYDGDRRHPV